MVNGKIYVGKDAENDPLYIGSGVLLEMAIRKYGKEQFSKCTIESCSNYEQLNEREVFWIKTLDATNKKIGYNIALGGSGGDTTSKMPIKMKARMLKNRSESLKKAFSTPEYRLKRSEISKNMWTPEHAEMMRKKMKGRKITWDTKLSKNGNRKGVVSEEHREKLRISSTGRECVKVDEETKDLIVSLYKKCGAKRMHILLNDMGKHVSPYIIRRTLKQRGVYEKWRKKRPEMP